MGVEDDKLGKKLAKRKLKAAAAARLAADISPTESQISEPKKKSKKKRDLAEANGGQSPQEEAAVAEEQPKKKKKKKSKQTEGEKQAPVAMEEVVGELEGKKMRKKKKRKDGDASGELNGNAHKVGLLFRDLSNRHTAVRRIHILLVRHKVVDHS